MGKQPGYLCICVFTRKQRLFSVGAPSFSRHVPGFFTGVVMHSGSAHLPLIITPRLRYAGMLLHERKNLQGREKRVQATGIGHDIHIETENNRGSSKYGLVEQIHTPCDHRDAPCDYIPSNRWLFLHSPWSHPINCWFQIRSPAGVLWGNGRIGYAAQPV